MKLATLSVLLLAACMGANAARLLKAADKGGWEAFGASTLLCF